MSNPTPSVARIVHYRLSQPDVDRIVQERMSNDGDRGNPAHAGDVVPLIIVKVWPGELVNGQAILDGNHSIWVCSASQGEGQGQWAWPPRV